MNPTTGITKMKIKKSANDSFSSSSTAHANFTPHWGQRRASGWMPPVMQSPHRLVGRSSSGSSFIINVLPKPPPLSSNLLNRYQKQVSANEREASAWATHTNGVTHTDVTVFVWDEQPPQRKLLWSILIKTQPYTNVYTCVTTKKLSY